MKKLVLLALSCVSFASMHGVFITTVKDVMARVAEHGNLSPADYERVESGLAARSHKSGHGRLFLLTPEILGEISATPGVRVPALMKSFLPMAELYEDEPILTYLRNHAALKPIPEERVGEAKEEN